MSKDDTHYRVWVGLSGLRQQLSGLVDKDPEQDVRGIAIPVIDALVGEARSFLDDDPVVARVQDVLSAGAFDGYVRAADLLLVSAY
jgi:hypothetical protein